MDHAPKEPNEPAPIGVDLTGDLPCVGCSYNLKGLSIRSTCPECGTPVRATILARVDPMAEQIQPLTRPRLIANGLLVWSWSAVLAALLVWITRLSEVSHELFGVPRPVRGLWIGELIFIGLSMLGGCVLIRPVAVVSVWETAKAAAAVAAYGVLMFVHYELHTSGMHHTPFVGASVSPGSTLFDPTRSMLGLAEGAVIVVITLGLRANAVSLGERSLVMRTGRVDTQPLTALAWAMGVVMAGHLLAILFPSGLGLFDWIVEVATLLMIVVGSFLFTIGLIGVGVDTLRLRPVLLEPAPGLTDIFREDTGERSP